MRTSLQKTLALLNLIGLVFFVGCTPIVNPAASGPVDAASTGTSTAEAADLASPCFEGGCHATLKNQKEKYQHQPFIERQCLACHETYHTEQTQKRYLQSDIDLCYPCHPQNEMGNSHPVGEKAIDINTGQIMTCTSSCHNSHASPYKYLLKQKSQELCFACHKEFLGK